MKIVKHARESYLHTLTSPSSNSSYSSSSQPHFTPAVGHLLGLDAARTTLEISNAFALPSGSLGLPQPSSSSADTSYEALESQRQSKAHAAARYSAQMLPRLMDVGSDGAVVGFYMSTLPGQEVGTAGFVEALWCAWNGWGIGGMPRKEQATGGLKGRLLTSGVPQVIGSGRKGVGVALVYGGLSHELLLLESHPLEILMPSRCLCGLIDVFSGFQGNVGLKAVRLTPEAVATWKTGKFDTQA